MKRAGETPYETDLNVWMRLEKTLVKDEPKQVNIAYVLKDRSDTINGKVFNMPKFRNFRPVVRFIQGLPVGEIAEETYSENFTPGSDKEYFEKQTKRKIEIEKIESIFEINGLGSPRSAEDKKIKTMIIEKIFGTASKTEIEKMQHTELNFRREELKELFEELKEINKDELISFLENYNKAEVV